MSRLEDFTFQAASLGEDRQNFLRRRLLPIENTIRVWLSSTRVEAPFGKLIVNLQEVPDRSGGVAIGNGVATIPSDPVRALELDEPALRKVGLEATLDAIDFLMQKVRWPTAAALRDFVESRLSDVGPLTAELKWLSVDEPGDATISTWLLSGEDVSRIVLGRSGMPAADAIEVLVTRTTVLEYMFPAVRAVPSYDTIQYLDRSGKPVAVVSRESRKPRG